MLTLITWLSSYLSGLSTVKLLFLSTFHYCALWKEVTVYSSHLRQEELRYPSFSVEYLHELLDFCTRDKCFLPHLLIYSIIYVYNYGLRYLLHTLGYNRYYFIDFITQIGPALAIGSAFSWLLSFFDIPPSVHFVSFLSRSLPFDATRWSRFILYVSFPSPRINHFSKEPWVFLLGNGVRDQDLGTRCALHYWDIASRPSQLTEQRNTCIYTSPCIYKFL